MINKTTDLVNTLEEFNQGDKVILGHLRLHAPSLSLTCDCLGMKLSQRSRMQVILTVRRGQEDVQIALALEESSSNS